MLQIQDLWVKVDDKPILKGINLQIGAGELHAIMGPNGSGKSTLAHVLAGREGYVVTEGSVLYQGRDLLALTPEERAREGIFLAFQYPVEIPGVSNLYFLKAAVNAQRRHRGEPELDAMDFLKLARERMKLVELDEKLAQRPVNVGFSGGEKKRNEIFQMALLEPKLAVLDETDSGLDIDALRVVAEGVNALRGPERAMLVITHYQRLLHYIVPDRVHVLLDGRIVETGDKELALRLEAEGYSAFESRRNRGGREGARAMTELAQTQGRTSPLEQSIGAWLDAPRPHAEPAWLTLQRGKAADFIREQGLPHPKLEHWRFTPVRSILNVAFAPPVSVDPDLELRAWVDETLGATDAFRVLVVNGRPRLPDANAPAGIEVFSIAELLRAAPERLEPALGRIAPLLHGFSALNDALFDDGIAVFVRKDVAVSRPLEIVHVGLSTDAAVLATPRLLVVAEAGSELSLIETHLQKGAFSQLTLSVVELAIGENARLEHVRIAHGSKQGQAVGVLAVRQLRNSRFVSRVASFGGKLQRLDLNVRLAEQGAECTLDGLYFVDGEEHVDHQTVIEHAAPHGTSLEKYKGVLAGRGRAVFDGTIVVCKGALKTNAHQENRNILLSDDAVINTKPHLEIDADDVRCSHGATVGQIDPDQVHYLRTRGIDLLTARTIVSYAFAREIVDRVPNEAVRRQITRAILARLPHGELLEELGS